jgi:quercetin dioxygenase-like cupin family protein
MRKLGPVALAIALVTCGGAPQGGASATQSASPSPSIAAVASPIPSYGPKAEGFSSKVLIEQPRTLSTSAPGYVWIATGATTDGTGVSAVVSDKESFTASYRAAAERPATKPASVVYATPDLPPMPVGRYTEGLRLVTVQPGGRSAAHVHSGFEGVLVLEGRVLVRSGGNPPTFLDPGQGFSILPKVPVQLINAGSTLARTLVYSISPEGAPFSTEIDQSP